jgi:hypothetical protein
MFIEATMEGDLLKLMILNLPNFLGFVALAVFMREQNKALLEELRRCNERNEALMVKDAAK